MGFRFPRFAAVLPLLALPLSAATLLVPGDCATIQGGIFAASEGDTVLVSPGTYLENIHFLGKAITLRSASGPEVTVIDGSSAANPSMGSTVRFVLAEGPETVMEGFTITGGQGCMLYSPSPSINYSCGGGICCYYAVPTLRDCRVVGNAAEMGGGCCVLLPPETGSADSITIEGCLFQENTAPRQGGGLMIEGSSTTDATARVRNCSMLDNTAVQGYGGIYFRRFPDLRLTNSIVAGNTSGIVGGLELYECDGALVDNCVFEGNAAPTRCVGLSARYCDSLVVANSVFWSNDSLGYDYEIYLYASTAEFGYCDVEEGTSGIRREGSGGYVWGDGNIDQEPLFEQGPLGSHHLAPTSPCIDAGDPDPSHDDPGDPSSPGMALWPALGTVRCDMGAFGGGGSSVWGGVTSIGDQGVEDGEILRLTCSPNPTVRSVQIGVTGGFLPGDRLLLLDLTGRILRERFPSPPGITATTPMDLYGLPGGCYAVLFTREGAPVASVRLVVVD